MTVPRYRTLLTFALATGGFLLLLVFMDSLEPVMRMLFPGLDTVIYDRAPFWLLAWEHFLLVLASSAAAALTGICLGIFVTRPAGREFLPMVNSFVSIGQTFPPVAVLAIAVPVVGFGAEPTVLALFLYGLLPMVRNTIAGLESVPASVLEAAQGMGMRQVQVLTRAELPLALPIIMAGMRTSVIINIGTATLGATIGAGGLGVPIIAGLVAQNNAYVLEGALVVGFFAILADSFLALVQDVLSGGRDFSTSI